jgi:hypothetical protein
VAVTESLGIVYLYQSNSVYRKDLVADPSGLLIITSNIIIMLSTLFVSQRANFIWMLSA